MRSPLKTAGIMLLVFGIGIPIVSIIVSILYIATSNDVFARLILLATGPVVIIPLWAVQIIGGVFALRRRYYTFVLVSSIIALLYWIPFLIFVFSSWSLMFKDGDAFFWLYLPLLIVAIAAFVKVLQGKKTLSVKTGF
jgi:hypothetical protein